MIQRQIKTIINKYNVKIKVEVMLLFMVWFKDIVNKVG